jgi:predicted  nucleic acid-binding Zn-ribbon protein
LAKLGKNDPKEHDNLKRQKELLDSELTRENNKYESLKELQKTYYPESVLKELKSEFDELKQKTRSLAQVQK